MSSTATEPEVMTLDEAAAYLRLPREAVEQRAARGEVPGRRVADSWRFLKAALDDWLRNLDGRALLLRQAGALADDETLAPLLASIYEARGRPETDHGRDEGSRPAS